MVPRRFFLAAALFVPLLLQGCGAGYLLQAARGQWQVMQARRPIERAIDDPKLPDKLRAELRTVREARRFAVSDLGLPDNRSYTTYADIRRPYVVWNVVATAEFSARPIEWCFPIAGCVPYRGYFAERDARKFAAQLAGEGRDVTVYGVAAYSTLGKFADPVLSSMLPHGDIEVAGTLFHELAHQRVYAPGSSGFNEAFAVAVEDEGLRRWLTRNGRVQDLERWRVRRQREADFFKVVSSTRSELAKLYASGAETAPMRARKAELLAVLARQLGELQSQWGIRAGFAQWLEQGLNNAQLASVATYSDCVPAFERLLASVEGDLPRFYAEVAKLAGSGRAATAQREALCPKPTD